MNEQERSEMEWLKRRASRLAEELGVLGKQIENLEQKLNRTETKAPVSATPPPPSPSVAPTARIHVAPKLTPFTPVPTPEATIAAPTEIPPIIAPPPPPSPIPVFSQEIVEPAKPETLKPVAPESAPLLQQQQTPEPAPPLKQEVPTPPPMAPALAPRIAEPKEKKSFEMQLGTVWLVRVGIVMLITGLVFFGGYAYKTYVMNFGPTGKVSLLYLASGMLLGAGAWLQRKSVKESLNNFGQVVFAGGLAAVYFTTYAAHHFEGLRVIPSNWLDGTLLLLWAGFMVWVADRKKSEVMALFAILLAYYTAVITNVGLFTLYSNLVLTLAAVFFFLRNRWAVVSFTSLAGSYFSYAYWRFLHGGSWEFPSPSEGLWTGACFLIAYWALFSGAVFLSRHDKFKGESRASFLTINNGAFFTLFLLTMWQMHQGGFWKFALIYGGALLGLAVLARWLLAAEPLAKNTYLTQGLLLATAGAISHPDLGGLHLSLVLAVESVTLLMAGQMRNNLVLKAGAYIAAALAVGWGMDGMLEKDEHGLWLGMGLVILMLGNALWVERYLRERKSYLRGQISYFTTLALAVLFVVTHNNTSHANFPLVLAGEAALFILSIYILQVRELTVLGQLYLGLAQLIWVGLAFMEKLPNGGVQPLTMVVLSIALAVWWQRQKHPALPLLPADWQALSKLPLLARSVVLLAATYYAISLAGGFESHATTTKVWLPLVFGAVMLADALLAHWRNVANNAALRLHPAFSTTLALAIWLSITWQQTARVNLPVVLAVETVALTGSLYLIRMRELTLLGQGYLLIGHLVWLANFAVGTRALPPWWNSALLVAITLGLSHWWQRQKTLQLSTELRLVWQGLYALALIAVLHYCISRNVDAPVWLALSTLLAVALTWYGVVTRSWLLAAFAQIFVAISLWQFIVQLGEGKPAWYFALEPLVALGVLAYGTAKWFEQRPFAKDEVRTPILGLVTAYRWVGLAMSLWWVWKYIPERERIWFYMLLGFIVFLLAGWRKSKEALVFGAVYTIAALAVFWTPLRGDTLVYLPNLLAVIALLGQQQLAKRISERYAMEPPVHGAIIFAGGLSLWLWVSEWVSEVSRYTVNQGGYMTASWSVVALVLFTVGILLRERVYRWLGLGILACAVGRVMIIDVWHFEAIYRVLSFMALGVVLLVLGFIYNKYQEKIKEWL